ncbi:MAG: hypothetical protein ACO1QB_18060 [Verrucomicrobiales bacterium]
MMVGTIHAKEDFRGDQIIFSGNELASPVAETNPIFLADPEQEASSDTLYEYSNQLSFDPPSGQRLGAFDLKMGSEDSDAKISYVLADSAGKVEMGDYTGSIHVQPPRLAVGQPARVVIRATITKPGFQPVTGEAAYTFPSAEVAIDPPSHGGVYYSPVLVSLSAAEGVVIRVSFDNTIPIGDSSIYNGPFLLPQGSRIVVTGEKEGLVKTIATTLYHSEQTFIHGLVGDVVLGNQYGPPQNFSPLPMLSQVPATTARLRVEKNKQVVTWSSVRGGLYLLERSSDLQNWMAITGWMAGTVGDLGVALDIHNRSKIRFYRVKTEPATPMFPIFQIPELVDPRSSEPIIQLPPGLLEMHLPENSQEQQILLFAFPP